MLICGQDTGNHWNILIFQACGEGEGGRIAPVDKHSNCLLIHHPESEFALVFLFVDCKYTSLYSSLHACLPAGWGGGGGRGWH